MFSQPLAVIANVYHLPDCHVSRCYHFMNDELTCQRMTLTFEPF